MAESTGGTGLLMERITVPERRVSLLKILGRLLVNRELSLVLCCLITVAALLAAAADIIISTNGSPSDAEDGQIRFIFSPQTLIVSCGMILMVHCTIYV
jgi:hypothetical protein